MSDSGRPLQTTPGHYDYPPASTNAGMNRPNRSSTSHDSARRGRSHRHVSRRHASSHPAPQTNTGQPQRETTPPWTPSSPETRERMQRVLRRVQELQEHEDTRRDIERRLQDNEEMLRANVERLRDNEQRLRDTGRRISAVHDQMRDLDSDLSSAAHGPVVATRSASSSQGTPRPHFVQSGQIDRAQIPSMAASTIAATTSVSTGPAGDPDIPVRAALREASERLRLVNDELRSILNRPLDVPFDDIQQITNVHNDMQRLFELRGGLIDSASSHPIGDFESISINQEVPAPAPSNINPQVIPRYSADTDHESRLDQVINNHLSSRDVLADVESREESRAQLRGRIRLSGATATSHGSSPNTWRTDHHHRESSFVRGTNVRATRPEGADGGCPRRKRRRLDDAASVTHLPLIQYGYEGQVVPGKLKLQLVSCDGGIVDSQIADLMKTTYGAENVLKDDQSVYCTKSQRCNMVLQHQHQTTFCLERLVIKAPKTGFSDPVQEGLVFVSMKNDLIFNRTAKYQIYYFPTSRFASHFASSTGPEHGTALEIEHPVLQPAHPAEAPTTSEDSYTYQPQRSAAAEVEPIGRRHRTTARAQESVAMSPSGSEDDNTDASSGDAITRDRDRINHPYGSHPRPRSPHQATASATRNLAESMSAQRVFDIDNGVSDGAAAQQRRYRRQGHASSSQTLANLTNADQSLDFLTPAARFSMRSTLDDVERTYNTDNYSYCEGSHTMTIKFEPPISGRFILLKMWSPRHGGNIDVQGITAHGFVGPRWFPATEMR